MIWVYYEFIRRLPMSNEDCSCIGNERLHVTQLAHENVTQTKYYRWNKIGKKIRRNSFLREGGGGARNNPSLLFKRFLDLNRRDEL